MSNKASNYLIALDDGHGMETAGKRTPVFVDGPFKGTFMHEDEFNREVVKMCNAHLIRCGFKTILTAPEDTDVPLLTRTNRAIKACASAVVSIHANAMTGIWGSANGIDTFAYPGYAEGLRLATCIHKRLIANTKETDRGVKTENFHMVREPSRVKIPSALAECGFMDNLLDAAKLKSPVYRDVCAVAIAQGVCDYFNVSWVKVPVPIKPVIPPIAKGTPIMGKSLVTLAQAIKFIQKVNPNFNAEIAKQFLEVGNIYGVRGDIALCQSIHETNWFRFGGDVKAIQNNFAGIGATGGIPGNTFATVKEGVICQIQHLYAYSNKTLLPTGEKLIDPRFNLVSRGSAPNWEDLGGKWAYPGYNKTKYSSLDLAFKAKDTYGHFILNLYNEMSKVIVPIKPLNKDVEIIQVPPPIVKEPVKEDWKALAKQFVIDNKISDGNNPITQATREEVWEMLRRYKNIKE